MFKKFLFVVCVMFMLNACSDADTASKALRVNGYTDITITGWDMFTCSKDDTFCTGFVATAPNGERVEGAVGSGFFFKGATIRLK